MLNLLRPLSAACLLALTACAAPQGQYQSPPRPSIDPLPLDLKLTWADRALCQRLLLIFSASPETLQDSCAATSASNNGSMPAGH